MINTVVTREKVCPECGSKNVKETGIEIEVGWQDLNEEKLIEYECVNCGHKFRVRVK